MNNLIKVIRERLIEKSNLTNSEFTEIFESEFNKFINANGIVKIDTIELRVENSLDLAETLVNDILSFLNMRFGISVDFENYENIKRFLARMIIELMINEFNIHNTKIDIVQMIAECIVQFLINDNPDVDKMDKIYLFKEFNRYLLNYYTEIDMINKEIVNENSIIYNILKSKTKFMLIPVKWITVSAISTYINKPIRSSNYLVTYLIGGKNEQYRY